MRAEQAFRAIADQKRAKLSIADLIIIILQRKTGFVKDGERYRLEDSARGDF